MLIRHPITIQMHKNTKIVFNYFNFDFIPLEFFKHVLGLLEAKIDKTSFSKSWKICHFP